MGHGPARRDCQAAQGPPAAAGTPLEVQLRHSVKLLHYIVAIKNLANGTAGHYQAYHVSWGRAFIAQLRAPTHPIRFKTLFKRNLSLFKRIAGIVKGWQLLRSSSAVSWPFCSEF